MTNHQMIQTKLLNAKTRHDEIFSLCLNECRSPETKNLLQIGSLLGDYTNNLRSCLNYKVKMYVEKEIKDKLTPDLYSKIEKKIDFPWAKTKSNFDKLLFIKTIRKIDTNFYNLLVSTQPFHQGNKWLQFLMMISNNDKHISITKVERPIISAICASGNQQKNFMFFGKDQEYILFITPDSNPVKYELPIFVNQLGLFAVRGGKWMLFWVLIDQVKLDLMHFLIESLFKSESILRQNW